MEETITQPPIELYKPPGCIFLSESKSNTQIRLGLQGYPKAGKTYAALTFPNPVVANLDRGLGAHSHREDVIDVPFYNGVFCDSQIKRDGIDNPPNRRDALLIWLHKEGVKLTSNQTLIVDSLSAVEDAFHIEYRINPVVTKKGAEQGYAEWDLKQNFFRDLTSQLKELTCNVILCAHQTENSIKGGFRPLLSGGFKDKLESHFTDWFRCLAFEKPTGDKVQEFIDKYCAGSKATLEEWKKSTTNNTIYLWQTQADNVADCGTSTLVNAPKYILAGYSSIVKYSKQLTSPK